jgi:hypothetical protein
MAQSLALADGFLIVSMDEQPDESVKVRAELQHVLQKDQIKHIKKLKLWCVRPFSAFEFCLGMVSQCARVVLCKNITPNLAALLSPLQGRRL